MRRHLITFDRDHISSIPETHLVELYDRKKTQISWIEFHCSSVQMRCSRDAGCCLTLLYMTLDVLGRLISSQDDDPFYCDMLFHVGFLPVQVLYSSSFHCFNTTRAENRTNKNITRVGPVWHLLLSVFWRYERPENASGKMAQPQQRSAQLENNERKRKKVNKNRCWNCSRGAEWTLKVRYRLKYKWLKSYVQYIVEAFDTHNLRNIGLFNCDQYFSECVLHLFEEQRMSDILINLKIGVTCEVNCLSGYL